MPHRCFVQFTVSHSLLAKGSLPKKTRSLATGHTPRPTNLCMIAAVSGTSFFFLSLTAFVPLLERQYTKDGVGKDPARTARSSYARNILSPRYQCPLAPAV